MSLVQLYIPSEISRDAVYCMGDLGVFEFRDLNKKVNAFSRFFVSEIRKLDNVQRQYRYLSDQVETHGITLKDATSVEQPIDELVESAQILEERVSQLVDSKEELVTNQMDSKQFQYVLKSCDDFFSSTSATMDLETQASTDRFVTGVVPRAKIAALKQILWRVLRGNLFFEHFEIQEQLYDLHSKSSVDKDVFVIFAHGDLVLKRIEKICESLDADLYFVDTDGQYRSKQMAECNDKLTDLSTVIETTTRVLETELFAIADELESWQEVIRREKSVYEKMNFCHYDLNRKCLIAEGWTPTSEIENLQTRLERVSKLPGSQFPIILNVVETSRTPPTYHKTNKFTAAFQSMTDAYGIASYREVNAALPTAATFPFMFAIMFGDLGHGFIMFLAALMMVLYEKKIQNMKDRNEIFDMAFTGRYILLLMGGFSMYTGFLYNDIFSISMTFFKSGFQWPSSWKDGDTIEAHSVGVYPFGLDPAWHGAENALLFANSYKMKLSILMGFVHMTYSYFFSLVNHIYFRSAIDIIGNFIPGLLFMQGIFGYLSVCIVYKWCVDWVAIGEPAPSLLNMLISMFLSPGSVPERLFSGQGPLQVFLLLMALVCVPWLLLVKPLWFKFSKSSYHELPHAEGDMGNNLLGNLDIDDDDHHEEHTFGDVMIHQVIHTIEFCLNTVSHTASYLRLWALSLAHSQLSTVLWSMTIQGAFGMTGVLGSTVTVFLFGMWFCLTVAILVVMEGTSAMLHALRLHWVESMSKFFVGEGVLYQPFSFKEEQEI